MFKTMAMIALTCLIALGGGTWSVVYALQNFEGFDALTIGQWQAYPSYGTSHADPYARAQRVKQGVLPLGRSEGLRFTLNRDNQGKALDPRCIYQLRGKVPAARFWTLTSNGSHADDVAVNDKLPAELHAQNIWYQPDGDFLIKIATRAQPGNWLAVNARRSYQLVLTLYDTQLGGALNFEQVVMPVLERSPESLFCTKGSA